MQRLVHETAGRAIRLLILSPKERIYRRKRVMCAWRWIGMHVLGKARLVVRHRQWPILNPVDRPRILVIPLLGVDTLRVWHTCNQRKVD